MDCPDIPSGTEEGEHSKHYEESDLEFSTPEDDEQGDFQILLNIARFQAQRDIQSTSSCGSGGGSSGSSTSGDPSLHFQQSLQRLVEGNQALRAEIERLQEREKRRLDMNMSGYSTAASTSSGGAAQSGSHEVTCTPTPPSPGAAAAAAGAGAAAGGIEEAREQRLSYLRNAFSRFVQAKDAAEVQSIGRVICTILNFPAQEQQAVNAAILRFSPAIVASSTIDTLSNTVSSFFNF
jgi:hypothetical protein